ncbi:MAG: nuclear transport factor 2 family protein [Bdellovibrionales bacterium]|nr:nuclear transport factor 2 family protein [Bdellovibrionales bacterium]
MSEKNQATVRAIYEAFGAGDYARALTFCDPKVTFQISGKSKLAGKYDATNFVSGLVAKWKELSGGQYKLEVHDVLASDRHAVALASVKFARKNGETAEYRSAQVWRIENGKPVAWYEYLRDGYQFDAIWS